MRAPKHGHTRQTTVWDAYLDVLRSLVDDATAREGEDQGWLFPRFGSVVAWADKVGHMATAAAEARDWPWSFHWLRHAFASVSMAPETAGGYGLDPASVSRWLGHKKLSTTTDTYVTRQPDDGKVAKRRTGLLPG